jgi:hypothetical protein
MTLPPDTYDYVRVGYNSGPIDHLDSTLVQISCDDSDESLVEVPVTVLVGSMAGIAGTDNGALPVAALRNYPNPFGGETTLCFHLEREAVVGLNLYNVEGRLVRSLLRGQPLAEGVHRIEYDGSELPSGVYFCRLSAGDVTLTRRMLRLRK